MCGHELRCAGVRGVHEFGDFLLEQQLSVRLRERDDGSIFTGEQVDWPDDVAHAPASGHLAGDRGQLADVGLRARRHVAEDELLGDPASEGDVDAGE